MRDKICKIIIVLSVSLVIIFSVGIKESYCTMETETTEKMKTEEVEGLGDRIDEFPKLLGENIAGTIISFTMHGIRWFFGGALQTGANAVTLSNTKVDYSFKTLESQSEDDGLGENKYVNVGEYEKDKKSYSSQKVINVLNENKKSKEVNEDTRFTSKTAIPVVYADVYNMTFGKIPLLDCNFLTIDKIHEEESLGNLVWLKLRGFASGIVHIVIYISAAFILIVLIIRAIQLVRNSIDNPQNRRAQIEGLHKFVISVVMLISTILIMTLCMMLVKNILNKIQPEETVELPIRVNVEEAGYSFSTNFTGYLRYMSGIRGVNKFIQKSVYTIFYIIVAAVNLIVAGTMLIRMIAMWFLAILGPIIVALYAINIEWPMSYTTWIKSYASLAFVQVIMAIICKIVLEMIEICQ